LLRLALLAALIAGLVAMHQLPTGDACCSQPVPSTSVPVAHTLGDSDFHIAPAPSPTPQSLSQAASHDGLGEHGGVTDMLGVCLAMLLAAAGLVVVSLLKLARGPADHHVHPLTVLLFAPPRGPPVPRRLAQLQVLRL
jgi:hypothetical protein